MIFFLFLSVFFFHFLLLTFHALASFSCFPFYFLCLFYLRFITFLEVGLSEIFVLFTFPALASFFFFPFYFLCLFCLRFSTFLEVGLAEMLDFFMRLVSPVFYRHARYKLILLGEMFLLSLAWCPI
jgi:hypothetical protein